MATDNPTSHERTMAEQAALISRMKDAVLPPSAGVDVGNLKLPVLRAFEFHHSSFRRLGYRCVRGFYQSPV